MNNATKKLYYEDIHMVDFTATVVSCTQDEKSGNCLIILDQTSFFPEEGGQKPDTGTLNGEKVLDVQIKKDVITHVISGDATVKFQPGAAVSGHVDWAQRFDFMQQHTGEHIISGLVHEQFGYNNVGFHLGYEEVTLDFDDVLTWEQLRNIETAANKAVYENLPVLISFPQPDKLAAMEYRSKIELTGDVRIVEIPGYDTCACCAPHVEQTGQIGMIKMTGLQSHRGGVRINILCGLRALNDYTLRQNSVTDISVLLSAKPDAIGNAVLRLKEESQTRQERINALQAALLSLRLQALPAPTAGENTILFEDALDAKAIRDAVNTMVEKYDGYCGIFSGNDTDGYLYIVGSRSNDCKTLAASMRNELGAKGGGSTQMIQGTATSSAEEIRNFFQSI